MSNEKDTFAIRNSNVKQTSRAVQSIENSAARHLHKLQRVCREVLKAKRDELRHGLHRQRACEGTPLTSREKTYDQKTQK